VFETSKARTASLLVTRAGTVVLGVQAGTGVAQGSVDGLADASPNVEREVDW